MVRLLRYCVAASALACAGCGNTPTDPFARSQVTGTVSVDGQPVQFGTLNVTGQRNEATQEQAIESYAIRDGRIMEDPGARGTTAGMNDINVLIFATDPADENKQAAVTGHWTGKLEIKAGEPLAIKIEKSALAKPERSID
jgi:hypothetical protein